MNKSNNRLLERLVKISAGQLSMQNGLQWQNRIKKAASGGDVINIYPGENVMKHLERENRIKEKRAAAMKKDAEMNKISE